MRILGALLFVAFFGSFSFAGAQVFSGTVTLSDDAGSCAQDNPGTGDLYLACYGTQPTSWSIVQGHGDPFSGVISVDAEVQQFAGLQGARVTAGVNLVLDNEYVMKGGTGMTTVNFGADIPDVHDSDITCSFTFDGTTQDCDPFAGITGLSEQVEYGVPFSLEFDAQISAVAYGDIASTGAVFYNFDQPGLTTAPEPSSILLLMPGLAGVFFAVKSRATSRPAKA